MHTTSKRVVITGLGAITPVGNTAAEFWQSLTNGVSGIGPITRFDASDFTTRIAGEVKDFDPADYNIDRKEARHMDISTQFAVAAAKLAIAGTLEDDDSRREPGVAFIRSQAGTLISLIPGITDYDIVTPSANIQPVIDATKVEWLRLGNVEVELL